jgi:3-isopropylmalate dehydrogenase
MMMLFSMNLCYEADDIEKSVVATLEAGVLTGELLPSDKRSQAASTSQVGDEIVKQLMAQE